MKLNFAIENLPRGIYTFAKPAAANRFLPSSYRGAYHLYLVKSNGDGDIRVIRSGPYNEGPYNAVSNQTRLEAQIDVPHEQSWDSIKIQNSLDWSARKLGYNENRYFKKWNVPVGQENDIWQKIKDDAKIIHEAGIVYGNSLDGKITHN